MTDAPEEEPVEEEPSEKSEFESLAGEKQQGLASEFLEFLRDNQKWWLLPILLVTVLLGALVILGPSIMPFLYAIF